jgi:hypothetical protein
LELTASEAFKLADNLKSKPIIYPVVFGQLQWRFGRARSEGVVAVGLGLGYGTAEGACQLHPAP